MAHNISTPPSLTRSQRKRKGNFDLDKSRVIAPKLRRDVDFQLMLRPRDPSQFHEGSAQQPAVVPLTGKHDIAMYGVAMQISRNPMLPRTFHSLSVFCQEAYNCDPYIAMYATKPMARQHNLFTALAVGLKRLRAEEQAAEPGAAQPNHTVAKRASETIVTDALAFEDV